MQKLIEHFNDLAFRIRWLFWTPKARYAYLWNRTLNEK
jgi:hypothetical protein